MNVLAIGQKEIVDQLVKPGYPDAEIDYVGFDIKSRKRNYYNAVVCYHALQLENNANVIPYLQRINKMMKVDGVLNLFVPSLEWAAEQILIEENPSQLLRVHLYGDQNGANSFHKSGHTLRLLRKELDFSGFAVTHAREGLYSREFIGPDGKPFALDAGQHIVICYKREEKPNEDETVRE